jgi:hypothetical protein
MIIAKNYAAQAEKGINDYILTHDMMGDDVIIKEKFLDNIKNAVHFSMPNNGRIFDDNLKGIKGEEIRLPFPIITIEYFVEALEVNKDNYSSKRVIYAQEITGDKIGKQEEDIWIVVYSCAYYVSEKVWFPDVVGWCLPSKWDTYGQQYSVFEQKIIDLSNGSNNYLEIGGFPLRLCPSILAEKTDYDFNAALHDTGAEINALLEFCEALSCSNVKHEIMEKTDPAVNQRRIRDGKVPIYETRTLWIDVPGGSKESGDPQGGTHRSPRQHLRRGHIRRLPTGKKVWVNAAVVGAKENGIIKKDYAIKEAA